MLAEGDHARNARIFPFRADAYLAAMERHQPDMLAAVKTSMTSAVRIGKRGSPASQAFAACPSGSVYDAITEREDRVGCVSVSLGRSDVGSWDSLHAISVEDGAGNAMRSSAARPNRSRRYPQRHSA